MGDPQILLRSNQNSNHSMRMLHFLPNNHLVLLLPFLPPIPFLRNLMLFLLRNPNHLVNSSNFQRLTSGELELDFQVPRPRSTLEWEILKGLTPISEDLFVLANVTDVLLVLMLDILIRSNI